MGYELNAGNIKGIPYEKIDEFNAVQTMGDLEKLTGNGIIVNIGKLPLPPTQEHHLEDYTIFVKVAYQMANAIGGNGNLTGQGIVDAYFGALPPNENLSTTFSDYTLTRLL